MENEMEQELKKLREENERLKAGASSDLRLKVSLKGAISLYGLGRFPVTLYKEQWEKVLGHTEEIKRFMEENKGQLKTKN